MIVIMELYGRLVEIDDNIYNEIKMLNEKNYVTAACCGGHIERNSKSIYITFIEDYDFKFIPNGFKCYKHNVLQYLNGKATEEEYEKALNNFKAWVRVLPFNEKFEKFENFEKFEK